MRMRFFNYKALVLLLLLVLPLEESLIFCASEYADSSFYAQILAHFPAASETESLWFSARSRSK